MTYSLSSSTTEVLDTIRAVMGDIDGDQDLDYLASNYQTIADTDKIGVYTNGGTGNFSLTSSFGHSQYTDGIASADIDGDGDLDALSWTSQFSSQYYTYKNNGAGTFSQDSSATIFVTISDMEFGDVDGNGSVDLVETTNGANTLSIRPNNGQGTFGASVDSTVDNGNAFVLFDADSDGDLDVALATTDNTNPIRIYKNDGSGNFTAFSTTDPFIDPPVHLSAGDLDGDGDIDLVATYQTTGFIPYFNNGTGTFSVGSNFGGVNTATSTALGDLDNDGDLDVILAGSDPFGVNAGNEIWLNNGAGSFTQDGTPTEENDCTNSVALGDIDTDGDLDYVAGNQSCTIGSGRANRHYKSDQAATLANTAPSAPATGFNVIKLSEPTPGFAKVKVMWGSGSDSQSAQRMLQYQLKLGSGAGLQNIVSGKTAGPQFVSRVMPNGQSRNYVLTVPCGETYTWSVATRDTSLSLSSFSTEQSFVLDGSCALTVNGGGGGGGNPVSTGGGVGWGMLRQGFPWDASGHEIMGWQDMLRMQSPAVIKGTLFLDANLDGKRHPLEQTFSDSFTVALHGTSWDGLPINRTATAGKGGTFSITAPASDARGYTLSVTLPPDAASYRITSPLAPKNDREESESNNAATTVVPEGLRIQQHVVVTAKSTTIIPDVGLAWTALQRYAPCLHVGPARTEQHDTESLTFLDRLTDAYGTRIMDGIEARDGVIARRDFLRLVLRTQCVPLATDAATLTARLGEQTIGRRRTLEELALRDASYGKLQGDAQVAYSLLASGIPAAKRTSRGSVADFKGPTTRKDAIMMLAAAMHLVVPHEDVTLPRDVTPLDPAAGAVRTLRATNVLPATLRDTVGLSRGLEMREAAELLARAAFAAGRVSLLPESVVQKNEPGFLAVLPAFSVPSCLENDATRAANIAFRDIVPGDPRDADIRAVVGRGTTNDEGKKLWLLPGTTRPTEFGVLRSSTRLEADEPTSMIDVLRALVILTCTDLPSRSVVRSWNGAPPRLGTAESRIPRDRLAGLPRSESFASRVLYASQDRRKEYDLSLFTFAPWLLQQRDTIDPLDPVSVRDGSDILASAILGIAVRQGVLTPVDATAKAPTLSQQLRRELLGRDIDWRNDAAGREEALTRGMLVHVLGSVIRGVQTHTDTTGGTPLGIVWWQRLMR